MRDKSKKVILLEIVTNAVIVSLPIDLLYLYFAGGWSEPNRIILGVELVVLFLLPIFGMWRVHHFIKAEREKDREKKAKEGGDKSVTELRGRNYFHAD